MESSVNKNPKKITSKNDKNGRANSYQNSFENYVKMLHFWAPQKGDPTRAFFR